MSQESEEFKVGGNYAKYMLGVFLVVYVLNFIDRQLLSILAQEIKMDLGITDAQIGFLFGTAFAIFYAILGIPLGKLADVWSRKNLVSAGIAIWSVMTALSGTARSFFSLATFRVGVAVGETSSSPAIMSMLSDAFSPRVRATVFAIYFGGVYIGSGIGVYLGGIILDFWNGTYPDPALAPLQLKAWQATFFIVGLPGLLVALLVATLKEPNRGQSEGIEAPKEPHPFRAAYNELLTILPPFTFFNAARMGARDLGINVLVALLVATVASGLVYGIGSPEQWITLGVGTYATFSWTQNLKHRDPVAYTLIFRCKTMVFATIGYASITFVTYGFLFWTPTYFLRTYDISVSEVGTVVGLSAAIGGLIGVNLGGSLSDWLRKFTVNARLYVGLAVPVFSIPLALVVVMSSNLTVAYVANFFFNVAVPMSISPSLSTVNDLVVPRMRAIASAYYFLLIAFIGLALGPYTIGQISDKLAGAGMHSGQALGYGMMASLLIFTVSIVCLLSASRHLQSDESTRLDRARAAGEAIE